MTNKNMQCRILLATIAGTMMIPGSTALAADGTADVSTLMPVAGIETALSESLETEVLGRMNLYMVQTDKGEYLNRAFSNVGDFTYIRTAPDESSDWNGKLYSDSMVNVLEYEDDWIKISSGDVEGYVPADTLYLGDEARQYEDENASNQAVVLADVLNVREGTDTSQRILTQISYDEQYPVTGEEVDGWYPIQVGDISGWVSGEFVEVEASYKEAQSREAEEAEALQAAEAAEQEAAEETAAEVAEESMVSGNGQAVIDFACQFIGNPYVWGGTSLTDGADCSGFVQSVYAHFGVSLPRTTWDMETVGTEIPYDQAMPGDIVLYDGHVGLYMGDDTIVNAMNEEDGIGICSALYAPIITVRRVI